jgi:hypothetical protein
LHFSEIWRAQRALGNEGTPVQFASQAANHQTDATAKESRAQRGIASAPRSKVLRVRFSLLRSFRQSNLRLVALEIRCFPLRILESLRDPWLRYGNTVYAANRDRSMGNFEEENRYSRVCTEYTQELQDGHRWMTPLDLVLAAQSHRAGAIWALDTFGKGTQDIKHVQSSEAPRPASIE